MSIDPIAWRKAYKVQQEIIKQSRANELQRITEGERILTVWRDTLEWIATSERIDNLIKGVKVND